jgi:hypothetical protein
MQITVNVPDELVREAAARGLSVEKYAEEVIAQRLSVPEDDVERRQKAVDAMRRFASEHGLKLRKGEQIMDLIREARRYK